MEVYHNTGIKMQVIDEVCRLARENGVDRVILFGSRARGDYKTKSDIDLAFSGGNWAKFTLAVDEETSTLLQFDIVNLDGAVQKELLESIEREGILIYEKV